MSIILKGIDMPKEKDEALLLLILGDGTVAEKIDSDKYEEMTDTKAIQIDRPHGRLIDGDELLSHLKKDPLFSLVEQYGISGVIESRPTILEAEE